MEILEVFAIIAAAVGIIGSVLPGLPGPPVSWVGILLLFLNGNDVSLTSLLVWLGVVAVVTVLDYVIPSKFTSLAGGHKAASTGALLGLLAGIFFTPVGMLTGCLVGAFIGELIATDAGLGTALKAALGAFVGFILSTGMKIAVSGIMAYIIVAKII